MGMFTAIAVVGIVWPRMGFILMLILALVEMK